ncbi:MAG: 2-oxoglutarate dehydrogenase E1 subunit family protein, partial [Alphaproteobacteria bacterium]
MARQDANKAFAATSFLHGANARYIEDLQERHSRDPSAVDATWRDFFDGLKEAPAKSPDWARKDWPPADNSDLIAALGGAVEGLDGHMAERIQAGVAARGAELSAGDVQQATRDSVRALMMIRAYRMRGHFHADLDPLGLARQGNEAELDPASYGFTEADFDRKIFLDHVLGLEFATIPEMLEILRRTYCSTLGIEFMHISDAAEKAWLQERIEGPDKGIAFTDTGKRAILNKLIEAEGFEK